MPGTGSPVAERLYYDSPELAFSATVTDVQLLATESRDGARVQLWQVALDRTAFYPESGGQPWDTGELVATARSGSVLRVPVERVTEDEDGEIWHLVGKPLVEGTSVKGAVDGERRRDHMQQHSGQHLLSAVFLEQVGAATVSFHLGAESATIDVQLPPGMKELAEEQIAGVERRANELIFEDRRLTPRWFSREQAETLLAKGQLRKLPERTGPMRVLAMDGIELNACGGTHVTSLGSIGSVLIRRTERVKGSLRVEFVCGLRAVRKARKDAELLRAAAEKLSCGAAELPSRVDALLSEGKAAAKLLQATEGQLAQSLAAELAARSGGSGVVCETLGVAGAALARRVASEVAARGVLALLGASTEREASVTLALPAGDSRRAGDLLRAAMEDSGARGGGGPTLAQATCTREDSGPLLERLKVLLEIDNSPKP